MYICIYLAAVDSCVYSGHEYKEGQQWQDGCQYNCVCLNETTGYYKCQERQVFLCFVFPVGSLLVFAVLDTVGSVQNDSHLEFLLRCDGVRVHVCVREHVIFALTLHMNICTERKLVQRTMPSPPSL